MAEFKQRLQADFNSRFTRPAPQAGVRRMKIDAEMDPKSDAKIDVWASRGPTFEVLAAFLRSLIFDEVLIGEKSATNLTFGFQRSAKGKLSARVGG